MTMLRCWLCGEWYPEDGFYPEGRREVDQAECRECVDRFRGAVTSGGDGGR